MKLVSWNIQWARGCDGHVSTGRIARALNDFADADVICLQEVARGYDDLPGLTGDDQVAQFATLFPDHAPIFAPGADSLRPDGTRRQFGNLTLSRLPVLAAWRHLLPWPADGTVPSMQRACVEVVLGGPSGGLRVLNTHLEYYSRLQRMAQIEALRALNAEALAHAAAPPAAKAAGGAFAAVPRPAAALLCGDLNCEPGSDEFMCLVAPDGSNSARWHDLWAHCHGAVAHADTVGLHGCDWPGRRFCCDFALASAPLLPRVQAVEVDQSTAASDHQPVWITLAD